jgi:predicted small metal-binding protein
MPSKQYKKLGCMDVDPKMGCAFEVRAETEDEVMRIAGEHGKIVHKMTSMPPDMAAKVKSAIKTVPVNV